MKRILIKYWSIYALPLRCAHKIEQEERVRERKRENVWKLKRKRDKEVQCDIEYWKAIGLSWIESKKPRQAQAWPLSCHFHLLFPGIACNQSVCQISASLNPQSDLQLTLKSNLTRNLMIQQLIASISFFDIPQAITA